MKIRLTSIAVPMILLAAAVSIPGWISPPAFRDLNKNGKLDVYEDKKQPVEKRVEDLLAQMTLEEKAGMMFINGTFINDDGSLAPSANAMFRMPPATQWIDEKKMTHFNVWQLPSVRTFAIWQNNIQKYAEEKNPAWDPDYDGIRPPPLLQQQYLFHGLRWVFPMAGTIRFCSHWR